MRPIAIGWASETDQPSLLPNWGHSRSALKGYYCGPAGLPMSKQLSLLQQVVIPKPCPVSWDQMKGDSKVRFCEHCSKNVYNLSEMSEREANDILMQMNGNLCGQIQRRTNGMIVTRNQYWWRPLRAAAAAFAATFSLLGFGCTTTTGGSIALPSDTTIDQKHSSHITTGGEIERPETTPPGH